MSHVAQHQPEDKKSDGTGASIKDEKQTPSGVHTVEALQALPVGSVDPVYAAKAQALNDAIQSIGMGRYQVISSPLPSVQHPFGCRSAPHSSAVLSPFYFLLGSSQVFHSGTCS